MDTGPIRLGHGWTARVDEVPGTDLFEIHVFGPGGQRGIVQGRQGWIAKHQFNAACPAGMPDRVVNALNGLNVRELRRRGQLPAAFRGLAYLREGRTLGFLGNGIGFLCGLADDAGVAKRALEEDRSFDEQFWLESWEQNPQYLLTPFGPMVNPYYTPIVVS